MKNHFIDKVEVIIDESNTKVLTITGIGYDPDIVKNKAISIVRESFLKSKIIAIIIEHRNVTLEQYKNIIGSNPPWLN